jgi:hypothetical protein
VDKYSRSSNAWIVPAISSDSLYVGITMLNFILGPINIINSFMLGKPRLFKIKINTKEMIIVKIKIYYL